MEDWTQSNADIKINLNSLSTKFGLQETNYAIVATIMRNTISADSSHIPEVSLEVKFNGGSVTITLGNHKNFAEKVIPKLFSSSDFVELSFAANDSRIDYNLNDTYLMVCSIRSVSGDQTIYLSDSCKAEFDGKKVKCNCKEKPETGMKIRNFLTFLVISCFWLSNLFWMFLCKIREQKPQEPEIQLSLIMCSARTAKYQYEIVFRVGCPSDNFDLQKTTIDIEIIGPQQQPIGTIIRFSANKLTDPVIADMRCLMGRLTPIPKIESIRANHSGRSNSDIFFYEFTVRELHTTDKKVIQSMAINDYIKSYSTNFKGEPKGEDQMGYYPDIPLPELTYFEIQLIVFFVTAIMAIVCMFLPKPLRRDSLLDSLISVILSSIVTLLIQTVVIYLYKYQIKKNDFEERYIDGNFNNKWSKIRYSLWGVMLFFAFLLSAILAAFGFQQTWTQAFFWFGSCLCSAAIVYGVWFIADATHIKASNNGNRVPKDDERDVESIASSISTVESQTDNTSQVTTAFNEFAMPSPTVSVDSNIGNIAELNVKKKNP
jgi:hypothetical protein